MTQMEIARNKIRQMEDAIRVLENKKYRAVLASQFETAALHRDKIKELKNDIFNIIINKLI